MGDEDIWLWLKVNWDIISRINRKLSLLMRIKGWRR